jgi:hypothetical protein
MGEGSWDDTQIPLSLPLSPKVAQTLPNSEEKVNDSKKVEASQISKDDSGEKSVSVSRESSDEPRTAEGKGCDELREMIHISRIDLSPCDEHDGSVVSGGDSLSMMAVNDARNPLVAISKIPANNSQTTPSNIADDDSQLDEKSDNAVSSLQNISRALVSDIMTHSLGK